MYQSFYALAEMPFNITPDPKFLYLSPTHYDALQHLLYGVREHKGFIVLIGEVGCGKTTLCRRINETEMLQAILTDLGETQHADGHYNLVAQINEVLLARIEGGRNIVLIIDEAQNLTFEVLEQIRLLSNLETDKQKLLQIVLIGQPELKAILARDELRQLRQRILVHYELLPLSLIDTDNYIRHRLALAGSQGRPHFTSHAIRKIHRASKGVPRVVNNLCDKAILSAFIRESDEVNYWDVRHAMKDLNNLTN
jgi:general secretion pathway protein A